MKLTRLQTDLITVLACGCLSLTGSCDRAQSTVASTPPPQPTTISASPAPVAPGPDAVAAADTVPKIDEGQLKFTVQRMLSPKLFKLTPETTVAYFESVSELQPQAVDNSWERRFIGSSRQPSMPGLMVEVDDADQSGHWRLGRAIVTWNPPKDQARALYERLVAEVRSARGRKPLFTRDESDSAHQRRSAIWTWCHEECEADIVLDTSGRAAEDQSLPVVEGQPVVMLSVYVPEGP